MSVFFSTLQLFNISILQMSKICSFCAFIGFWLQFGGGGQTRRENRKTGKNRAFLSRAESGKKEAVLRWKTAKKRGLSTKWSSSLAGVFWAKREENRPSFGAKTDKKRGKFEEKRGVIWGRFLWFTKARNKILRLKIVVYSKKSYLYKKKLTRRKTQRRLWVKRL